LLLLLLLLLLVQVRLTFKPESQQLWIASNTTTQKREWAAAAILPASLMSSKPALLYEQCRLQWSVSRTGRHSMRSVLGCSCCCGIQ
jgi:hypothetical protein